MSDGKLELASIPVVYNVRHQPARAKRSQLVNLFDEQVVRVASWNADQAPLVARLVPGINSRRTNVWGYHHPGRNILDDRQEVVYRAARGADGRVRLVSPIMGEPFVPLDHLVPGIAAGPASIDVMSHIRGLYYPGSANTDTPQRASTCQLGGIISSERTHALAYGRQTAQGMVLVDGVLHMPCSEPGWSYERHTSIGGRSVIIKMFAHPNPDDSGRGRYSLQVPYGMDWTTGMDMIGREYAGLEPILGDGMITDEHAGVLGSDPAWAVLQGVVNNAIHDYPEVVLGMGVDEVDLLRGLANAVRDWPSARNLDLVAQAGRLVRIVWSVMPNKHEQTMKSMLALEASMARTPGAPSLEARMAAAGLVVPEPGAECPARAP